MISNHYGRMKKTLFTHKKSKQTKRSCKNMFHKENPSLRLSQVTQITVCSHSILTITIEIVITLPAITVPILNDNNNDCNIKGNQ